jgi:NAD+ diphosphatase
MQGILGVLSETKNTTRGRRFYQRSRHALWENPSSNLLGIHFWLYMVVHHWVVKGISCKTGVLQKPQWIRGDYLEQKAFFFHKDTLAVEAGVVLSAETLQMPLVYGDYFPAADVFSVPALTGGEAIFCVSLPRDAALPLNWQAIPVRRVLSALPFGLIDAAGPIAGMLRVFHIAQWRRESQFCGSCGNRNTDSAKDTARRCSVCDRMEFPRITPAVITIIFNDEGKVLLAHNKKFPVGLYSLIAGFAEAGEHLEAAVVREVREEVNIEICDIRYVVSQSWPFPDSLMMGFSARHASGIIRPDGVEIEDARWFGRDELPVISGPGSLSRCLIDRWLDGQLF